MKGSKAPRVQATCEQCGAAFERSAVHPYIVRCPACRGARVQAPAPAAPLHEAREASRAAALALHAAADSSDEAWLEALGRFREATRAREASERVGVLTE